MKFYVIVIMLLILNTNQSLIRCHAQSATPYLTLNSEMHNGRITSIESDAENKFILTVSRDKTAKLWDAQNGRLIRTLRVPISEGNSGMLYACALSSSGKTAVVGGWSGFEIRKHDIYFFSTSSGAMLHRIGGLPDVITDLKFSPDDKYLSVCLGSKNGINVYQFSESTDGAESCKCTLVKSLTGYEGVCMNAAWAADGRLATICYEGKIRIYDRRFNLIKEQADLSGKRPFSLAFSNEGSLLAVGYNDSPVVQVFDGKSLALLYEPDVSGADSTQSRLMMVSFSQTGNYLVAGGQYNKIINDTCWWYLRVWADNGRGRYSDFSAGRNAIMDIRFIARQEGQEVGDIIYTGGYPDFARVSITGKKMFYRAAELNNYYANDRSHFKINHDGSQIVVCPYGATPLLFDANSRTQSDFQNQTGLSSYTDKHAGITVSDWKESGSPEINSRNTNFLGARENTLSADISDDGSRIIFGAYYNIYCTDTGGNKLWASSLTAEAWAVNISGNGKVVAAALSDGTIRWFNMEDGKLLMSLFMHPDKSRHVLWSPDGRFDASAGAEDLIGWHVNQGADKEALYYTAGQFYEKLYTPNLGVKILRGDKTEAGLNMNGFQHPPLVQIISPDPDQRGIRTDNQAVESEQTLEVTVEVTDQGGGIDEIVLYHNGKLVQTTHRGFRPVIENQSKTIKTFTITLVGGENRIRASAFNTQRTEATPHEIVVHYTSTVQIKPNMYILAIGINEYLNPRYNLNYAKNDAEAFVNAMQAGAAGIFDQVSVTSLYDSKATRAAIMAEFDDIKTHAREEDVFVFYYAGHGVMSSGQDGDRQEFYLVPHDITRMYESDAELQEKGISAQEIAEFSKNISSQKQLFILDACQSGGAVQSFAMRGSAEEKAIAQLSRSTGTYFLAASGTEQFATEVATLGHGIFTYSIIEALHGGCQTPDGRMTVHLLKSCVEDMVPELSKKYKGAPQYPTGYGFGQDFPIVIIKQ